MKSTLKILALLCSTILSAQFNSNTQHIRDMQTNSMQQMMANHQRIVQQQFQRMIWNQQMMLSAQRVNQRNLKYFETQATKLENEKVNLQKLIIKQQNELSSSRIDNEIGRKKIQKDIDKNQRKLNQLDKKIQRNDKVVKQLMTKILKQEKELEQAEKTIEESKKKLEDKKQKEKS